MTVTKPVTKRRRCGSCGAAIAQPPTGRPRQFCNAACRNRAHRRRQSRQPTKVYHRSQSDEWATPRDRWVEWNDEFGFTLDAAATVENALCERFFTAEDDGLAQEWTGTVWCNPPYSSVGDWVEKGYTSSLNGATVVMLVPARTDTGWWHAWAMKAEIDWIKGRLKFGDAKSGAPFPSVLLVFRGTVA